MTRRDAILLYICDYARAMHGPTPSIREVALHFGVSYSTAYYHVTRLIEEGRLRQDRGKLIVVGGRWVRPEPDKT